MSADDHNVLADQFLHIASAFCGRCEGALNFFAVDFDDESFAVFVEGLEFARVGDGFAATSLAGNDGETDESQSAEDGFHN